MKPVWNLAFGIWMGTRPTNRPHSHSITPGRMEHLTKAIESLLKPTGTRLGQSFLGDVHRYLSTGDAKLLPGLLKLDDAKMNTLCGVATAAARPDKWGVADLRLIEFFV